MLTTRKKHFFVEHLLVRSCSPALCGIKPASLVSLTKAEFEQSKTHIKLTNIQLARHGKQITAICRLDKRILLLVHDVAMLNARLSEYSVQQYLEVKGYNMGQAPEEIFKIFAKRLATAEQFPHEAGVFLGYPVEDVIAFEKNPNQGWKFCGTWKAYNNVEYARKISATYNECNALCRDWYSQGCSIPSVIKKYSRLKKQKAI